MSQCKVWLDNYTGQYYPGNLIQGKVILNFNSETKLRGIKVRIVCHEHTEWMGEESYYDSTRNKHETRMTQFRGDNDAFATELILHGGHSGTTSLPAGQHMYPFSIVLPTNLPGTYSCDEGNITYKLISIVDRPMAFDYQDELIFVVVAPIDLNLIGRSDLLEPTSYSNDKTICCWCCAQGPISLDVELPRKTLTPGETVNITARVSNMSNTNLEGVRFKLTQNITCKVDEPNRDDKTIYNTLVEQNDVGLGAHGEHTYTFPVMLPMNIILPNFCMCRLFRVEYTYKVTAKLPGVHSNLEVQMNPEIGNVQIGQAPTSATSGYTMGFQVPTSPSAPNQGLPYPPVGGVPVFPPSAPPAHLKEQDQGYGGGEGTNSEPPPPSYDSLNLKN
ncbi:unnamed protein product [Acanthoscelides obtectus]|nr:unnamed protein product [Acanthoscelides obtectus]CAK1625039.1 Arrestin domain-containing protein 3 [Acanthoscelides obtectus]